MGGAVDLLEIIALPRGKIGFHAKMSHAENAIHRRANLVAHVCQEITLCLCRLLGLLPCRANCFLRAFALGNVSPDRVDQPPAMLLDGRQQDLDREDLAVGAPVQPLEAEAAAAPAPSP